MRSALFKREANSAPGIIFPRNFLHFFWGAVPARGISLALPVRRAGFAPGDSLIEIRARFCLRGCFTVSEALYAIIHWSRERDALEFRFPRGEERRTLGWQRAAGEKLQTTTCTTTVTHAFFFRLSVQNNKP